jgi:pyridoxal phosphate enzyme (YggS family)
MEGAPADVAANVLDVRRRIADACRRSGREARGVRLIAASKTVSEEAIRMAAAAGVEDFGENRPQELAAKAPLVPATWHFLGTLQRGTVRHVADHAAVVHSAEPGSALEALAGRAARRGRTIRCLIEVDFTGARHGVVPEDVGAFAEELSGPREGPLRLVGLMTIPPQTPGAEGARPYFAKLRDLRDDVRRTLPEVVELSMGMSADYEVAVEEGATMVRVGTALFGPRPVRTGGQ